MLSKAAIHRIRSLNLKKNRYKERLFIAEGHKTVDELLKYFKCRYMYATDKYLSDISFCERISYDELRSISMLETPQDVIALFEMPEYSLNKDIASQNLVIALDNVQDAGNLGTIIRIADWFGIEDIVCSIGTVDVYNPKCVQATMGALPRVRIHYSDLKSFLRSLDTDVPIYATTLNGSDIYKSELKNNGVIVMGNEGNGVTQEVLEICNSQLFIPNYPVGKVTSESLNVGVATAVICAEFRRRSL